jgi:hypothetical protein
MKKNIKKLIEYINDKYDFFNRKVEYFYFDHIKPIFKPCHKKLRKSIPRTWADTVSLIVDVNFAMIKEFYEDEYLLGFVDWKASSKNHENFEKWLKKAYKYITEERPLLNKKLELAYPPSRPIEEMFERIPQDDGTTRIYLKNDKIPYKVKYKEVIRIEKLIHKKDTEMLQKMIESRDYFWT